ncbi:hypothetical protein ACFL54_03805 [Planctomycetota bacterium]
MLDEDPLIPKRKRKIFLVDRDYQSNYSFTSLLLSYCLSMAVGFFGVASTIIYYKYIVTGEYKDDVTMQWAIIGFFIAGTILVFWMVIVIVIVSILHSHRVAGAVYRMKADIKEVLSGDYNVRINLRQKDYFKDLTVFINNLIVRLKATYKNKEIAAESALDLAAGILEDEDAGEEVKKKATEVKNQMMNLIEEGVGIDEDEK